MEITIINALWCVGRESIHPKEMGKGRHSFCENEESFLISQGMHSFALFSMSDRKEKVAHRPLALEKPLTGCVSRTQPLVCFAEE